MIILLALLLNQAFAADPKPASSPTQVVQITDTSATVKTNFGSPSNALRTSSLLGNQYGPIDFGAGATTASSTVRTNANQGLPNSIANAWPIKITDGTDNTTVKVVKEDDQYNGSDFGLPVYGVDREVNPRKYHAIKVDSDGTLHTHILDPNGNKITSTLVGAKQSLDVNVTQSALPSGAATEATLSLLNANVVSGQNTIVARQNTMISNQQLLQGSVSGTNTRIDSTNTILSLLNTNLVSASNLSQSSFSLLTAGVSGTNSRLDTVNTSVTSNTAALRDGSTKVQLVTSAGVVFNMGPGAPTSSTVRTVSTLTTSQGAYYQFTGSSTTVALPTQITGGDGLYRATVDSLNRLSVNANINFPEAVYTYPNLLSAGSKAMNVNGSVTPVSFSYAPASGTTFYVEDMSYFIADNAAFTTNGFGALGALTNGLIIEFQSKGVLYTLTNTKDNGDLSTTFSDSSFGQINAGLLSTDAYLTGTKKFQQRIALDGNFGDFFRARVRDNLTGLTTLNIKVKAWRVN